MVSYLETWGCDATGLSMDMSISGSVFKCSRTNILKGGRIVTHLIFRMRMMSGWRNLVDSWVRKWVGSMERSKSSIERLNEISPNLVYRKCLTNFKCDFGVFRELIWENSELESCRYVSKLSTDQISWRSERWNFKFVEFCKWCSRTRILQLGPQVSNFFNLSPHGLVKVLTWLIKLIELN